MKRDAPIALMVIGLAISGTGLVGVLTSRDGANNAGPAPTTPTAAPTTPTAAPTTPTTSLGEPTTPSPAETPTSFYAALANAFTAGYEEFLFVRLHPAVVELYGEAQCRVFVSDLPGRSFEVLRVGLPEPWNYGAEREGRDLVIDNAVTVDLIQRIPGRDDVQISGHIAIGPTEPGDGLRTAATPSRK